MSEQEKVEVAVEVVVKKNGLLGEAFEVQTVLGGAFGESELPVFYTIINV